MAEAEAGGEGLGKAGAILRGEGDPVLDHGQEEFFLPALAQGGGQFFQTFLFVEPDGFAKKERPAKALA
ncbi:MAG: hypothetical protein EBY76_08070, partial [Betaproteobacteria bacterium]|nr:hypothetical protein [Betaproteobacteria bacterium]